MRNATFNTDDLSKKLLGTKLTIQEAIDELYPGMDWITDAKGVEAEELDALCFKCSDCGIWFAWEHIGSDPEDNCCENCKP